MLSNGEMSILLRMLDILKQSKIKKIDSSLKEFKSMVKQQKEIKILCTLGPSSINEKVICRLDECGVTVFRLNLSHILGQDHTNQHLTTFCPSICNTFHCNTNSYHRA